MKLHVPMPRTDLVDCEIRTFLCGQPDLAERIVDLVRSAQNQMRLAEETVGFNSPKEASMYLQAAFDEMETFGPLLKKLRTARNDSAMRFPVLTMAAIFGAYPLADQLIAALTHKRISADEKFTHATHALALASAASSAARAAGDHQLVVAWQRKEARCSRFLSDLLIASARSLEANAAEVSSQLQVRRSRARARG